MSAKPVEKEFEKLHGPRQGRELPLLAAVDLSIVVAIVFASSRGLIPLSSTPFLFVLGWISLRLRGLTWSDVGFTLPLELKRPLLLGVAIGIALELFVIYGLGPVLAGWTGQPADVSEFQPMVGSLGFLLLMLGPMWLLAGFGEELVYRGFLLNRIAGVLGKGQAVWLLGIALVAGLFYWAHSSGQITGVLQDTFASFVFGGVYLACGRNLTVPIVAHGVAKTLAFILIYFGRYPGL